MKRKILGLVLVIGILLSAGCTAGFLNYKRNMPAHKFNQAFFKLSKEFEPVVFYIKKAPETVTFYLTGEVFSKFYREGEWRFYLADRTGIVDSDYIYVNSFGKFEVKLKGRRSSRYIFCIAKISLEDVGKVNISDLSAQSRSLVLSSGRYIDNEGNMSVPLMSRLVWEIPFVVIEIVDANQEEKLCHLVDLKTN